MAVNYLDGEQSLLFPPVIVYRARKLARKRARSVHYHWREKEGLLAVYQLL